MSHRFPIEGADGPPYPAFFPVVVLRDYDYGWIVEAVVDGEYESQEAQGCCGRHALEDAIAIARERGVRVAYYPPAKPERCAWEEAEMAHG